jgi:signal transduction histidine kinase/DNA-binding response OmpR family regulator/CHASE3 domain sensor protein
MPGRISPEAAQFKRVLTRHLTLPLGVGALSALVFIALIFQLLSVLNWVDHSQQVIANANELTTLNVDLQNGVRGYLLNGDEKFLATYDVAKPKISAGLASLAGMVGDNKSQVERLKRIQAIQLEWDEVARNVVNVRRQGGDYQAITRTETGRRLFDELRMQLAQFVEVERRLLAERSQEARDTTFWAVLLYVVFILGLSGIIAASGRREIMKLSTSYGTALNKQIDSTEALQQQAWVRAGQTQVAEKLIGQLTLPLIGRNTLDFMASYLGVAVAAMYAKSDDGLMVRLATYGFAKESIEMEQAFAVGHGLVGQAAADGRISHVKNLPEGYFKVSSGLGEGMPAEVVVLPINNDGDVNGAIELGFMRPVTEQDLSLLGLVAAAIGAAVAAAQYRQRLQASLEETRQLNEELQVQQEELRTTNEELEEQSRALTEAQSHLEHQHTLLERTNERLAEQALNLDRKNEALNNAQSELQERADELQRSSRYKSEFLANMSHELRTPLNSTLILAKLLRDNKDGNLNAEQLKFAETIYSAGNDLLNLINDILDISKVEAGKLELAPQSIPVRRIADSLRSMFEPLARQKKLSLDVLLQPGAPETIFTDNLRLEQVMKNLLSNAIKFTEAGKITLAIDGAGDQKISFAVTDSGIGIPVAQQETIFEAFRQADGTINRRYGGTGLGLAISRELAGLLGGRIQLVSQPGHGSTFTLVLPAQWAPSQPQTVDSGLPAASALALAPARVPAPDPVPPPPVAPKPRSFTDDRNEAPRAGGTVLIVEDDPEFANILFDLAHEMRYRCLVAQGAEEAIELAQQHLPNAILLDVRLPDGSGLGVLQQLKENPNTRHIPVHVVAGEDFSSVALPMGAIGVAVKPTTREQLRDIFTRLEEKGAKKVKRVLLVEDDERQRDSVAQLIGDEDIEIAAVDRGEEALALLRNTVFDCMIIDLKLPDMDGRELLERMTSEGICSFPPVIVYTGRNLTRGEEADLNKYSRSIILKGARSPERLLDEVTLFLHKVESQLSTDRQGMLKAARSRDKVFEGRKVLLVDDDVRNIFALTSALERMGLRVEIGRNGIEALSKLEEVDDIDLVLMDVMMPGMDGLEATRRIRSNPRLAKMPVLAITAKAMKDDQEQCRKAGCNDYLAKPIELDRLFSLLRVWMPNIERR